MLNVGIRRASPLHRYVRKGFSFLGNWLSFDEDGDVIKATTTTSRQKEEIEPSASSSEQNATVQPQETPESEHTIAIFYATETGTAKVCTQ